MPDPHDIRSTRPRSRTREAGFTLLELLIAVIIIAILMAAMLYAFRGAKKATYGKETKAAASAYVQAISQYQADHTNLLPTGMGQQGPLNLLKKPYMRGIPDGVAGGRIAVNMASCSAPITGTYGGIGFCPGPPPRFDLVVKTRPEPGSTDWTTCYVGGGPLTATKAC